MAKVAIEMVKKSGIDLDKLLKLLIKNASAELTTYYYYTILRANLIGLEGEGIKQPELKTVTILRLQYRVYMNLVVICLTV